MREYARMRGISVEAVSKAVKTRRIALVRKKVDVALADKQWPANTQPGQKGTRSAPKTAGRPKLEASVVDPLPLNGEPPPGSYAAARARREDTLAKIAEMEYQEKMSELVNAAELRGEIAKLHTEAKTRILGVASKIKARVPTLTAVDLLLIEDLLREALGEIASGNG